MFGGFGRRGPCQLDLSFSDWVVRVSPRLTSMPRLQLENLQWSTRPTSSSSAPELCESFCISAPVPEVAQADGVGTSESVGLDKIVQARLSKGSIGFTSRIAPAPAAPASEASAGTASATALPPVAQPTRATSIISRAGQVDSPQQDLSPLLEQVEPQDLVQFGLIPE